METDIEFSRYENVDDFGYIRDNIESGRPHHSKYNQEYIKVIYKAGNSDAFVQDFSFSFNVFQVK